MKTNWIIGLCFWLVGFGSFAAQTAPVLLKPLPPAPQFSFDPGERPEIPRCVDLAESFRRLSAIVEENNMYLTQFMGDSARVIQDWHAELQPLEGQTVTLAPATFSPLSQGSSQISEVVGLSYENADYIRNEMLKISQALVKCIPQQGASLGSRINH